jgi:hypothetical protein
MYPIKENEKKGWRKGHPFFNPSGVLPLPGQVYNEDRISHRNG